MSQEHGVVPKSAQKPKWGHVEGTTTKTNLKELPIAKSGTI